jgi:hypothetical protein
MENNCYLCGTTEKVKIRVVVKDGSMVGAVVCDDCFVDVKA